MPACLLALSALSIESPCTNLCKPEPRPTPPLLQAGADRVSEAAQAAAAKAGGAAQEGADKASEKLQAVNK